jgi:phage N-6-adenine-methyltransferase
MARYEEACRAVAAAASVDEAKDFRDKSEAMRAYARQAKNKQLEVQAAEIRIRAERRIGELMAAQRDAGLLNKGTDGAGNANISGGSDDDLPVKDAAPTLAEAGIDKHLADRARKFAAIPEREFNDIVDDWRGRVAEENERVTVNLLAAGEKKVRGTQGTGDNEWYTPQEHVERARRVMGAFDVDPASNPIAQEKIGAGQFYTEETNGLAQEWNGRIWLNPPYAQPLIGQFMSKLCEEYEAGRCTEAVALTHNYTDTRWFQDTARAASAICFTRGRIKFYSPSGDIAAPTQGQAFFYFGPNVDAFASEFSAVGFVVEVRHE